MINNINLYPKKTDVNFRQCNGCSKCCEGYLSGEAYGHKFNNGINCYFLKNNSCTIYSTRPENPCKTYHCAWLLDKNIPEELKPSMCNVILTYRNAENISYLQALEAGQKIDSVVLSKIIQFAVTNNYNLEYQVDKKFYFLGHSDFIKMVKKTKFKEQKYEI